MSKTFRKWAPDQMWLLPPSPREWLGEDHLVYFLLDGSKVKANASRHKAMSYERMQAEEQRLQQEIADLLAAAKQADEDDDARFGDRHGEELPDELKHRESRLQTIRQAREALEEQARQKATDHVEQMEAAGRQHRTDPAKAVPKPTDQRNFTDPESKIMKVSNKGFDQCGNAQIVTDENQIILAVDVTNRANDVQQVEPLLEQLQSNIAAAELPGTLKEFLADAGYYSESNVDLLADAGLDPFVATQRLKHTEQIPASSRGRAPDDLTPKQRMARKLRTKKGRETYSRRKAIVEPVFGQIKACRGFRQFLLRGLQNMQGEWTLVCLTHNLLKAFNAEAA